METKTLQHFVVGTDDVMTLMELADVNGWDFHVVGEGTMLTQHHVVDGWDLMPLELFEKEIPDEGLMILEEVRKAVPILGVIIADKIKPKPIIAVPKDFDWGKALKILGAIAGILAVVVLAPIILFGIGVMAVGLAGLCGGGDPLLLVVLEDETYLQVFAWVD